MNTQYDILRTHLMRYRVRMDTFCEEHFKVKRCNKSCPFYDAGCPSCCHLQEFERMSEFMLKIAKDFEEKQDTLFKY